MGFGVGFGVGRGVGLGDIVGGGVVGGAMTAAPAVGTVRALCPWAATAHMLALAPALRMSWPFTRPERPDNHGLR